MNIVAPLAWNSQIFLFILLHCYNDCLAAALVYEFVFPALYFSNQIKQKFNHRQKNWHTFKITSDSIVATLN
jgi:hypothetical protein